MWLPACCFLLVYRQCYKESYPKAQLAQDCFVQGAAFSLWLIYFFLSHSLYFLYWLFSPSGYLLISLILPDIALPCLIWSHHMELELGRLMEAITLTYHSRFNCAADKPYNGCLLNASLCSLICTVFFLCENFNTSHDLLLGTKF